MIGTKGDIMCIPHQKPAKPQRKEIRKHKVKKTQTPINRDAFEHGDKNFIDERKTKLQRPQKEKGFFAKLFS